MRETSLYCRPDIVLHSWSAMPGIDSVLLFGKDKHGKPLGPYDITFIDTNQQLCLCITGLAVLLPLENLLPGATGYALQIANLLRVPRHLRKPDNYVHPDDPDLRRLLSKGKQ